MSSSAIVIHDASDIISTKININLCSIDLMKKQIEYSKAISAIQAYNIARCEEKIRLVETLNDLFKEQLGEFILSRQDECLDIYRQLNEFDLFDDDIDKLCTQLGDLDTDMKNLNDRIVELENQLPPERVITQITLIPKKPMSGSCAAEMTDLD